MGNNQLNEQEINYINSLDPAERDELYHAWQERIKHGPPENRPPVESLESLTDRLAELSKNPRQSREERSKINAEMDRQLKLNVEQQLRLFINDEIEKGGALNTTAIKQKAKSLGLIYENIVPHIHTVQQIRRMGQGGE